MRTVIERLAPEAFWRSVRDIRDSSYLAAVPRERLSAEPSREVDDAWIATVFRDQNIEASWNVDHGAITTVLKDENVLGGINPGDRRAIYYLTRALNPRTTLEIGTHVAASTLYVARALKTNGTGGRLRTVDIVDVNDRLNGPWKQAKLAMPPRDLAVHLGCLDIIDFTMDRSLVFLEATTEKFDFLFLDGDHRAHAVYREVARALNTMAAGGLILLHDYYPDARPLYPDGKVISGPYRAMGRICRENADVRVRPLGALPWATKQGGNATSLAIVTCSKS